MAAVRHHCVTRYPRGPRHPPAFVRVTSVRHGRLPDRGEVVRATRRCRRVGGTRRWTSSSLNGKELSATAVSPHRPTRERDCKMSCPSSSLGKFLKVYCWMPQSELDHEPRRGSALGDRDPQRLAGDLGTPWSATDDTAVREFDHRLRAGGLSTRCKFFAGGDFPRTVQKFKRTNHQEGEPWSSSSSIPFA